MPRNGSGTYTLPSGNPVTTGTLIEASWANTTLSDIGSEMTDSLSRSGEGGMLAPLRLADGSLSTPGLAFSNEVATGFYRAGASDLRLAVGGNFLMQFGTTNVGIGTTSPQSRLDVYGTTPFISITSALNTDPPGGVKWVDAGTTRGQITHEGDIGEMRYTSGYNGYGGYHTFYTDGTERFRILANGALSVGSAGTGYGTSGQVLTSNGNAAPSWTTVSSLTGITTATTTALGLNAGDSITTGTNNTIVGYNAGTAVTSGTTNVLIGEEAGLPITSGFANTQVGYKAGATGGNANANTFIGYLCGNNIAAGNNTAVGQLAFAGGALSSSANCVAVGTLALNSASGGGTDTAVGYQAGYDLTTANWCTLLGAYAGTNVTTGGANTLIGYNCGQGITTGTTNSALGDSAYLTGNYSNSSCIGYDSAVSGSNQVQLGNSSTTAYAYGAVQDRSDARDKTDIRDTQLGLAFVMALRPRDFKWDMREDYRTKPPVIPPRSAYESDADYRAAYDQWKTEYAAWEEANKLANITHDGTHTRTRYHQGLIAQEVKQVMDTLGVDFGGYQDHSIKGGDAVLSLGYEELIAPLIKAVQELKAEVDALKAANGS